MFSALTKARDILLDILFPPICLNCQKMLENENKLVCDACFSSIKINNSAFCPICRARLANNQKICHQNSLFALAAAGDYDDPILQNVIQIFKYQSVKNLAPVLGELIIQYIRNCKLEIAPPCGIPQSGKNSVIVPIPLHSGRKRQRGFNQAKLIAEYIGEKIGMPVIENLRRIKKTESQAKMKNKKERQENVLGCFKIQSPELTRGKNIVLIDDVFTTGATMNEAAKVLKENGCGKIIALVAAKV